MSESKHTDPMRFFTQNVDRWGAAEWFDRLVEAVREQDKAVMAMYAAADDDKACHEMTFQTYRNIAASSAMHLVRDFEKEVRAALSTLSPPTREEGGRG